MGSSKRCVNRGRRGARRPRARGSCTQPTPACTGGFPAAALRAADPADLAAAVSACREHGMPITMRGAGTSLAGQAVGPGLVVDTPACAPSRSIRTPAPRRIEPGVVLDQLNTAAAAYGLTFGPDVATANRATLGGMIVEQLGRGPLDRLRADRRPRGRPRRGARRRHHARRFGGTRCPRRRCEACPRARPARAPAPRCFGA